MAADLFSTDFRGVEGESRKVISLLADPQCHVGFSRFYQSNEVIILMRAIQNIRLTRRAALRSIVAAAIITTSVVAPAGKIFAQGEVDASFSNSILPTLGLPAIDLVQTSDGVEGVPTAIPAGRYLVNYSSTDVIGYLLFAQYPRETPLEEALELAKQAGSYDQQAPGWVYAGGSYVEPGGAVQVVVELSAGDWNVVTSQMPEGGDFATEEIYSINPFTVTAETDTATPVAINASSILVDMPGMAYVMESDTVPAGPNLWQFQNSGDQSHHVVMMRTPTLVNDDDIKGLLDSFASGTPPAGDNWYMNSTWVGYTALVSPGHTVWNEFDLQPGTYLMVCWISDIETGMPHLMMGMWTAFTVA